jgi:amino acid adenylation domain-containing protein
MSPSTRATIARSVAVPAADLERHVFPASSAQQRFWILDQLDSSAAAYTIPIALRLSGSLDVAALRASLNAIVARHESLRTIFALEGEEPVQVVLSELALDLQLTDVAALSPADRDAAVASAAAEAANQPFDLGCGPLVRASLLRLTANEHVLLLTLHHIVADGVSVSVLYRELEANYAAFAAGRQAELPPLPLQYPDYAVWQRRMLEGAKAARQLAFWKEQLVGPLPVLELPTDRPRPAVQTSNGSKRELLLPADLVDAMRALGRREGATPYMVFLAAFIVLLRRYTEQDDLIVGSITAGRERPELESMIGLFVNTIALRVDLSGEPTYIELLKRVRETSTLAMTNQEIPFEEVVEAIGAGRDRSRSPVFQVAFQLLESLSVDFSLPGLAVSRVPSVKDTTKFELTLMLNAGSGGGLRAVMEYNADLFDAATIDRMLAQFRALLGSIVAEPAGPVTRLAVMLPGEYRMVVDEWNRTTAAYPADSCVHDCVSEQARRTPDATAVEMDSRQLTFADLDRSSNRVAHRLRDLGVSPGVGVGVCIDRSPELIIALLAVLKAGGHYVPLAADYPLERLEFMRADAALSVLLTSPEQAVPPGGAHVLHLDEALTEFVDCPDDAPHCAATPESAAYVIYTSGSTGKPKGVVVPHRAVVNYIHWMRTAFPHDGSDAVLQKAPVSFDASVWELYLPLFTGARMVLARAGSASDPAFLIDAIRTHEVTSVQFVPSQLQVLTEVGGLERCTGLRRLFCGGEALPAELLARIASILANVEVTNLYGPTETTIYSTYWTLDRTRFDGSAPIGRPLANTQVYVLDPARLPVPIGVPGELYIGGAGVSHGYLGRPELTVEKFVDDTFSAVSGARMYRTGDRVRWRADGALEYLGRIDHQVKLRGHRIELGEVESVLARHPGVAAAAAIIREDVPGDKRFVAYVVPSGLGEVNPAGLREHVRLSLPEIMVPSAIVLLERLPLNANAKLDRSALPVPGASALATNTAAYVAPRTPLETDIAGVWATVLRVDRVGVCDDFFDLGGHSLAAMRVLARLTGRVPAAVTLGAILKARTVAGLAAAIEEMPDTTVASHITRRQDTGPAPLSHPQQLIWLFEQMTPGLATYNVPMVRRVRGTLDVDALRQALGDVVDRHEVLRTTFDEFDGEARQVVHPAIPARLDIVDLRGVPDAESDAFALLRQHAAARFDLAAGPLLRSVVVRVADDDALLLLVTHHIVFDGGSVGVLMRDLSAFYDARRGLPTATLPALPIQFADYAVWERATWRDERRAASLDYWTRELEGAPGSVDLPTDRARNAAPSGPGARHVATFPAELATGLRQLAREHDATLFMVLLGAFQSLLHRYSGQDDIVVGSPIAARVRPETQDLIGYFANTLALRSRFDGDPTFVEQLAAVRRACLDGYEHQNVPYEKLVLELRPRRSPVDAALFSVMFVLQDGETAALRLGEAQVQGVPVDIGAAKFDLTCSVAETAAGLRVSIEYRADLFDAATIQSLTNSFEVLLSAVLSTPALPVSQLPLLMSEERHQLLVEWNDTAARFPDDATMHGLVSAQAALAPGAVAVVHGLDQVTYSELEARAAALAGRLRAQGVQRGALIGVCVERSVDMVVALLGVQQAGGAYVPLDPSYPQQRIEFMLDDTAAPVLVTHAAVLDRLPWLANLAARHGIAVVGIDAGDESTRDPLDTAAGSGPTDVAYVIYTSGSTGRPKGVLIEHRNAVAFIAWAQRVFTRGEFAGVLASTSICFDLSVFEIFATLASGGTVVVADNALELPHLRSAHAITLVNTVPSAIRELLRMGALPRSVQTVNLAGEPLAQGLVDEIYGLPHVERVYDLYGPSETTTYSTYTLRERGGRASIGRPIANTRVHVLDRHLLPTPIGVPGELYIAGAGVARGYLGRPELTAERFVPDPFSHDTGARMYRTGDRVRWRPDGVLELLGRFDNQVKLRGHRIELGEIEAVVAAYPGVESAVAVMRDFAPGDPRLMCYFVAAAGANPSIAALLANLHRALPSYMVPAAIMPLASYPLTPNGKLDRRALPAPVALEDERPYTPPRGALEEVIAGVWADVLALPRVSVDRNFFELGGHSLLATQVVARVTRLFRMRVTLRSFFEHPTVREFASVFATTESKAGQAEAVAGALLRLRDMTPDERERLRSVRGA